MASSTSSLSVVIPVYNSEMVLRPLIQRLAPVLAEIAQPYELILVNDGSRDASWHVIDDLVGEHHWIRGIDMMRNVGQHNALLCGIRAARYGTVLTMDDDLQHPPEEIWKLLRALSGSADVVYGTPESETHGFVRDLASQIAKLALQKSMGAETARKVSAFRAFRTQLRDAFSDYKSQYVSIDVLLTWGTTRFTSVPVRHDPRAIGVSNYTYRKLLTHAMNMVTGFSTLPLQFASLTGFVFTLFGILLLMVVGVNYVLRATPPGFTFIASVIAIFSGAQLFALGIMGEYLARIHSRMMDRPTYSVRATITAGDDAADRASTKALSATRASSGSLRSSESGS
jgi:undecaprenyl-phosphate 4-deoxy-4-formamido-L-arabinose transferase